MGQLIFYFQLPDKNNFLLDKIATSATQLISDDPDIPRKFWFFDDSYGSGIFLFKKTLKLICIFRVNNSIRN